MAQNMHTAGRKSVNIAVRDGPTFMGQARNTVADPTLNVHPANFYLERFGVPDAIDPNNLDDLPRNAETIASTFQDSQPTVVANYIVDSTLYNQSYEHFVILPPKVSDKGKGVTSNVLRFNSAPWDIAPEGSSGSVIRHEMETTTMTLERYGQSMEMMDDFANTPEGEEMYNYYIQTMKSDLVLSGQIAVMTAILRCYDNKRAYMQRFGSTMTRNAGLDSHTSMFGVMYKNEKAFYKLSDYAKTMGLSQNAATFTHVFMTYATRTQAALGDNFENEFFRRGPKSSVFLEGGTDAVQSMPGSGLRIITEPDYNELDGTEMRPGERLQMLENDVSIGRWNAILLDKQIVSEQFPVPTRDMNLGYINFDVGNGQIQVQEYTTLLRALLCWQRNGELRRTAYDNMISGGYAEELAKQLGIGELTNRNRPQDGALIDPFIVDGLGGIREIVRYVGNMHLAFMDRESADRIVGSAFNVVKNEMTAKEWEVIDKTINLLEDNYNTDPLSPNTTMFVKAMMIDSDAEEGESNIYGYNRHGAYNIPSIDNVDEDFEVPLRGYFPGFSSMQHLRTIVDFSTGPDVSAWRAKIVKKSGQLARDKFSADLDTAAAGLRALEKFAKICKSIWSNKRASNAFFAEDALPFWMRGTDLKANELDAFLQNIVIGLRYPAGFNVINIRDVNANQSRETRYGQMGGKRKIDGEDVYIVIDRLFRMSTMFNTPLTMPQQLIMYSAILKEGIWAEYEDDIMENPQKVYAKFQNEPLLPGGWESVLTAMKAEFPVETNASTFSTDAEKEQFAEIFGLVMTYLLRKIDGSVDGTIPQDPYTPAMLESTITLAKVTRRKQHATAGKRKFVRSDAAKAHDAQLLRRANIPRRLVDSEKTSADIANTTLSFTPKFWGQLASIEDGISTLIPTEPSAPGIVWATELMEKDRRADANSKKYMKKISRAKYDIDTTRMGNFAGSAFKSTPVEPSSKRRRREDGGQSSGARYVTLGGRRDVFPDDMDDNVRSYIVNQGAGIDDGNDVSIWSEYNSGHDGLMIGTGSVIVQEANLFFQKRWVDAVERHDQNLPLLAQHLLLLGQRVHRDSFIQMAEMGVPAPVGILTVDPMIKLTMSHAVFVSAGCGNLYYAFENTSQGYDPNHKKLTVYMTIWMKGFVQIPQNVFIAENISFAGYLGGGDGSLIHTIAEEDNVDDEPSDGFDYDPVNPTDRRGNRFVIHVGISTRLRDIPNPLPLNGSFGGQGAMTGLGRYVNDKNVYVERSGALYDSALITNEITKFYQLNTSTGDAMGVDDYFDRTKAIGQSNNLVCFQGDQFGFNKSTGDHRLRKLVGTGHLGKCCEGVTPQMNGEPGLFSQSLALTGQ